MKRIGGAEVFTILVLITMILAVIEAMSFPFLATIYPVFVASIVIVCCVISLARKFMGLGVQGGTLDIEVDTSITEKERFKKGSKGFLYVLFLYAVAAIFGFKLGALIFITTYVLRETKAKWPAVLMMAGSTLVLLIAFNKLLNVWWTEGLLGQWEWLYENAYWLF